MASKFKRILQRRAQKAKSTKVLGRLHPYQGLGMPLVTEKAYKQVEESNTYRFRVHKDANKNDIRQAVKSVYDVTPRSVRVINVPAKGRMQRQLVRR
jgi:large subunit ribosomal protein L23